MESFGEGQAIYENIDVLDPEPDLYRPNKLPERETELSTIHSALRPITLGGSPRNILVYGPTGQGKTVAVNLKTQQLVNWADGTADTDLTVLRISCKGARKSWNVLSNLVKAAEETRLDRSVDKPRGNTKTELFDRLKEILEEIGGIVVIVLDEIDGIEEDNYVLYELPRATVEGVSLGVIGITNDYQFHENLDSDVRSSLGSREVVFSPYDANQLRDILARRSVRGLQNTYFEDGKEEYAYLESDVLASDVIPLCAAISGRDTGDARQAIRLLSTACDLALDEGVTTVEEKHVRKAQKEIQEETVGKAISGETTQRKVALLTVLEAELADASPESTTDLYKRYKRLGRHAGIEVYQRGTFREKLNDLAHGNIIDGSRTGRGRGRGMTNKYQLAVDIDIVIEKLSGDSRLDSTVEAVIENRQ
ncbi:Cdc6/Cdc18 family protein [Haloterrigena salifodinae]|uniref:Cdc6/Cdc18 family protein n=1 Tax=Haloterrigena salifodinae TaxID=2675099 RepID=UPI000F89A94F|nr:AAA family ATPase [Haloterrigena salifodinae]